MRPDAERILAIFRLRGLRAGSLIYLADLRQSIAWNRGLAKDGDLRRALGDLLNDGYLVETRAAVELTPKAEAYIYGDGAA